MLSVNLRPTVLTLLYFLIFFTYHLGKLHFYIPDLPLILLDTLCSPLLMTQSMSWDISGFFCDFQCHMTESKDWTWTTETSGNLRLKIN